MGLHWEHFPRAAAMERNEDNGVPSAEPRVARELYKSGGLACPASIESVLLTLNSPSADGSMLSRPSLSSPRVPLLHRAFQSLAALARLALFPPFASRLLSARTMSSFKQVSLFPF